jgi:hypothetical protein
VPPGERSSAATHDAPEPDDGQQTSGDSMSTTVAVPVRAGEGSSARSAAVWSPLAALRGAIDAMFPGADQDLIDAIRMAACELGENVVKYGEPVDGIAGHITVSRTESGAEIRAVNRLTNPVRATRLSTVMKVITESGDLRAAFEERMLEIMQDPVQESTGLGLLRIAYEGLFELSSNHSEGTLTIVAARSFE